MRSLSNCSNDKQNQEVPSHEKKRLVIATTNKDYCLTDLITQLKFPGLLYYILL